jgi:hypothetical protein
LHPSFGCHWCPHQVRDGSAKSQRMEDPPRFGLLGPGSYSEGGAPERAPSKQRRTSGGHWVRPASVAGRTWFHVGETGEWLLRPRKVRSGRRPVLVAGKAHAAKTKREPALRKGIRDSNHASQARRGKGQRHARKGQRVNHRTALPASGPDASVRDRFGAGLRVAEGLVVAAKPGNSGGAKGPQSQTASNAGDRPAEGDWWR